MSVWYIDQAESISEDHRGEKNTELQTVGTKKRCTVLTEEEESSMERDDALAAQGGDNVDTALAYEKPDYKTTNVQAIAHQKLQHMPVQCWDWVWFWQRFWFEFRAGFFWLRSTNHKGGTKGYEARKCKRNNGKRRRKRIQVSSAYSVYSIRVLSSYFHPRVELTFIRANRTRRVVAQRV